MKTVKGLLVFLCFILIPVFTAADMKKAEGKLTLDDPAGDVQSGEHPGKDVVKFVIESDGKDLDITVFLEKEAKYYLEGHMAGSIVDVYLDTDGDAETGDKPFWSESKGFDYMISIKACIEYGKSGTACTGSLGDAKETNFFSTYDLYKLSKGKQKERLNEPFEWKSRGKDIEGERVEVRLAYSLMNLSSGQSIRILVEERDGPVKKNYMPEAILKLK